MIEKEWRYYKETDEYEQEYTYPIWKNDAHILVSYENFSQGIQSRQKEQLEHYAEQVEHCLKWLDVNQKSIIEEIRKDEMYDLALDWMSDWDTIKKDNSFYYELEDGELLPYPLEEEKFFESLYVQGINVYVNLQSPIIRFDMFIDTEPDFFVGHSIEVFVNVSFEGQNENYTIEVNGIDKNVTGSRSICSPVAIQFLIMDGQAMEQDIKRQEVTVQEPYQSSQGGYTKAIAGQPMSISSRGTDMIAKYEGCRLQAYKCPAGVWTIGYGHTAGVKEGDTLSSKEAAKALLKQDLEKYAGYVNVCMKNGKLGFQLNQNQFDALTSFAYNCGNGSLQKLVTGRDAKAIAEKMLEYNKGGGKVLQGLVRRRQEEHDLFLS